MTSFDERLNSATRGNFAGKLTIADMRNIGQRQDISQLVSNLNVSYSIGQSPALSFNIIDPFQMQNALGTTLKADEDGSKVFTFADKNYFIPGRDVIYETQTNGTIDSSSSEIVLVKQLYEIAEVTFGPGSGISPQFSVQCYSKAIQQMKRDRNPSETKGTGTSFVQNAAIKYGLKFYGEQTSKKQTITKASGAKQAQSLWDVMTSLAGEVNFVLFEVDGILVFASEKFLLNKWGAKSKVVERVLNKKNNRKIFKKFFPVSFPNSLNNPLQLIEFPTISKSANDAYEGNGSMSLNRQNATQLRPGMTTKIEGIPNMSGYYLITDVSFLDMAADPVSVTFRTPVKDPEKENPKELALGSTYQQTITSSGTKFKLLNTNTVAKDSTGAARTSPWLSDARLRPLPSAASPYLYPRMAKANLTKLYNKSSIFGPKAEESTLEENTLVVPGNIDLWNRPVLIGADGIVKTLFSTSYTIGSSAPFKVVILPTIFTENGSPVQKTPAQALAKYNAAGGYLGTAKHLGVVSGSTKAKAITNARDYAKMLSWQNDLVVKKRFNGNPTQTAGGADSEWT